jgi:hypothetical protein
MSKACVVIMVSVECGLIIIVLLMMLIIIIVEFSGLIVILVSVGEILVQ